MVTRNNLLFSTHEWFSGFSYPNKVNQWLKWCLPYYMLASYLFSQISFHNTIALTMKYYSYASIYDALVTFYAHSNNTISVFLTHSRANNEFKISKIEINEQRKLQITLSIFYVLFNE